MRDAATTNAMISTHLHALVNTLLGGNSPGPVANLLTASRLIALAKPGGGARPIAIGECLTRLTAKAALTAMGEAAREYFLPLQYGVAVPGGAETAIHTSRAFLDARPNSLLGLTYNPQKCAAWSSTTVTQHQLPHGVPFSKDGVRLLGSYVGTDTGAAGFLSGQFGEMARPLPLIERADPQMAALLLTRCISKRVAYLIRTNPLHLLPRATWSQWGRDLLITLLTSCDIGAPTCGAEQKRVWEQASLPTSLGGIGLTDPLTEGIYGFTASFTQAALFLSSLALEPEGALTMAKNHMLAPWESGTPLPSWLTECKAALPLDAREILEKERLERSDVRLQHVLGLKVHGSRYANCDCADQTAITDPRLPNHLLRCGTGKHRINTHNELRDVCISMAQHAGFIVHSESAIYCPIEEQTVDFTMTDRSSGAVYLFDVTITDPISTIDREAEKGRGWAAREQADKKIKHYANRPETVGFFPLAVDTYGCPCAEVPFFLKLLADTAARRHFNADSKSFYAAKFLHLFRQRWSVALQRAQSVGLLLKLGEAAAAENPPVGGIGQELHPGDCYAVVEPYLEL
ncbi:unnamed protein product [Closterium sp. NIES-54]